MNALSPIRILVVDDHEVIRRSLTIFLRAFENFELVGEAANGREAVALCTQTKPNVVLMDMVMPEMDGVAATRAIRAQDPNIQVIALSTFKDEALVRDMLKAGAVGYLLKNTTIDELASAIRAAFNGKLTLSPEAARALIDTPPRPSPASYNLSERELEVLQLMAEGLNNVEIAERLVLARSTVKFHVSSILAKLNVSSRVEAVRLALQSGLIKPPDDQ
ncbi:MAG: response regulator transcription factor [Anaerolineae bacterium]|nr:response regulator transcription factor [Anaerolineae bacterium]